jgi:hypothetical protein
VAELKASLPFSTTSAGFGGIVLLWPHLDMSAVGLAFYLPSAIIDEHFYG